MRVHPTGTPSRRKAAEAAGLDCAAAFQKMALGCVADIKAHHTSACAGDAEAVHQIRVAITRLLSFSSVGCKAKSSMTVEDLASTESDAYVANSAQRGSGR